MISHNHHHHHHSSTNPKQGVKKGRKGQSIQPITAQQKTRLNHPSDPTSMIDLCIALLPLLLPFLLHACMQEINEKSTGRLDELIKHPRNNRGGWTLKLIARCSGAMLSKAIALLFWRNFSSQSTTQLHRIIDPTKQTRQQETTQASYHSVKKVSSTKSCHIFGRVGIVPLFLTSPISITLTNRN